MKKMVVLGLAVLAAPAAAADTAPCGKGLVCASVPQTVADEVVRAGYKAKIGKDKIGDPKVDSAASGYDYEILFYDCEQHQRCAALQFYTSFTVEPGYDLALMNKWNETKRFGQMALAGDSIRLSYDISTVGGINRENFASTLDWWGDVLGGVDAFFKENAKPATKPGS